MKMFKILIILLISSNAWSLDIFKKKPSEIKRENRQKELKNFFGKMDCFRYHGKMEICENKFHYCYRYDGYKEAALSCFWKKDFKGLPQYK